MRKPNKFSCFRKKLSPVLITSSHMGENWRVGFLSQLSINLIPIYSQSENWTENWFENHPTLAQRQGDLGKTLIATKKVNSFGMSWVRDWALLNDSHIISSASKNKINLKKSITTDLTWQAVGKPQVKLISRGLARVSAAHHWVEPRTLLRF